MNRRELLQEQYEDALFALLMDEVATTEGRKAVEENERLKNDPSAAVPEDIDKHCRHTIRQYFSKRRARTFKRFTKKAAEYALMAAGLAALLFTFAFATSERFRAYTLNLIVEVFETNTDFRFVAQQDESDFPFSVGWMAEGYELEDYNFDETGVWCQYQKSENEFLYINYAVTSGSGIGVDTEGIEVKYVYIHDARAMLIEKENECQLTWTTKNNTAFICLISLGMESDDLIHIANELKY